MKKLFTLRGVIDKKLSTIIAVSGFVFFLLLWYTISRFQWVPNTLLPPPSDVFGSIWPMIEDRGINGDKNNLIDNILYSLRLNFLGYAEAIAIAIPLGFIIGLFPFFRELLGRYTIAARFLPLSAVTGLMIVWYGIEDTMKIQFLALGIFVYLLPTVVDRINQTLEVYVQTAKTLGASNWQIIKTVFFPDVISRVSTDIINITAISWTYIVIAEMVNNTGGIGAMIWSTSRRSHYEQTFALLFIIILIGFLQDIVFRQIDAIVFPHKYKKPNIVQRAKNFFFSK